MSFQPAPYLRQGFLANATTAFALGLFLVIAAALLSRQLALTPSVLLAAGGFHIALATGLGFLALRPRPDLAWVRTAIAINLIWALTSLLVLLVSPPESRAGTILVLAQAGVAGMYAALQMRGLARSWVPAG